MSLVYCCKSPLFNHAVSCWMDSQKDEESLFLLPAFQELFTSNRPRFFMPGTSVLSFDSAEVGHYLPAWLEENIINNPTHSKLITQVGKLMDRLILDQSWAKKYALIVTGALSPEELKILDKEFS